MADRSSMWGLMVRECTLVVTSPGLFINLVRYVAVVGLPVVHLAGVPKVLGPM